MSHYVESKRLVQCKRLSGEIITLEVISRENDPWLNDRQKRRWMWSFIMMSLNERDPVAYPTHRTKVVYDEKEDVYHILVNAELNINVRMESRGDFTIKEYYDCIGTECWKCDEIYEDWYEAHYSTRGKSMFKTRGEAESRYPSGEEQMKRSLTMMETHRCDGFEIWEYHGTSEYHLRLPMAVPTLYHLYVLMMDDSPLCNIVYQLDTDDEKEYTSAIEEIRQTKQVPGREEYRFRGDGTRDDWIIVMGAGGDLVEAVSALEDE